MSVSVLLIDDHHLIRQGLRHAFEQTADLAVVAEAGSLDEALVLERRHDPAVCVVDVNLGDGSGIDFVRQVRARRPAAGLVVLTMYDGDEHVFAALEAGASSFVLKGAPADDVVTAVRLAATSPGSFHAPDLAGAMRRRLQAVPAVHLTPRETDLLQLLGGGCSISQIATQLYISQSTAKTHLSKLYDKLGASNRAQAVLEAVRRGLLSAA